MEAAAVKARAAEAIAAVAKVAKVGRGGQFGVHVTRAKGQSRERPWMFVNKVG